MVFICTFASPSLAANDPIDCEECDTSECCANCKGVYWRAEGAGSCEACNNSSTPENQLAFCPGGGGGTTRTLCTTGAGADYPFAGPTAKSKYECYKKLDGGSGDGHGANCQGDSGDVSGCRAYYRDNNRPPYISGCGNTGTPNLSEAGTDENGQPDDSATSSYHMEDTQCYNNSLSCSHAHILNSNDWSGTATYNSNTSTWDQSSCYKSVSCGVSDGGTQNMYKFYGDTCVRASSTATECDSSYHFESEMCYSNERQCNLFDCRYFEEENCTTEEKNSQQGTATWNGTHWNTNCTSIKTSEVYNCDFSMIMANNTSVNSVTSIIDYDEYSYGYCTSCLVGYIPKYYSYFDNQFCDPDTYICACEQVPQGYYGSPTWSGSNVQQIVLNAKSKCPVGKTTDGPGATNANECRYTNETKFCGDNGCFTLDGVSYSVDDASYTWNGGTTAAN